MSDTCDLSTYAELADLIEALPLLLRECRRSRRLSLRAAADQLGCAASTLVRYELDETGIATDTLVRIVRWLDEPTPNERTDQ